MKWVQTSIFAMIAFFISTGISFGADLDDLDVTIRVVESDDLQEMQNELSLPAAIAENEREHAEGDDRNESSEHDGKDDDESKDEHDGRHEDNDEARDEREDEIEDHDEAREDDDDMKEDHDDAHEEESHEDEHEQEDDGQMSGGTS